MMGQRPQRGPVTVDDDGLAREHPPQHRPAAVERDQGLVIGVRGPHDRGRESLLTVGVDEQVLAGDLVREYCQNGLRSGVDSVTGIRAGGVWYAEAELMKTYCPVRPRNRPMSAWTCPGVNATQSTTASKSRSLISSRTARGSRMSARSIVTPGGSGRVVLCPRFRTDNSMPLSTATREHAELMTPLPPMNKTLSFPIPLR